MTAEQVCFTGADGNTLRGEVVGAGPLVLLLHGGGQTRRSWRRAVQHLVRSGRRVLTVDLRGHGDSDWSPAARYALDDHIGDLRAVLAATAERPALVGASMGGITAMLTLSREPDGGTALARCLVLVDVTPTMQTQGLERIRAFMAQAPDGFASVADAADAVAAYLPGRRPSAGTSGLLANLRVHADQRYHWHWDPRILDAMPRDEHERHAELRAAAAGVRVPTMLVRGSGSEVVGADGARELRELIPHAVVTEVAGAGHTAAGSDNDPFAAAVAQFVARH